MARDVCPSYDHTPCCGSKIVPSLKRAFQIVDGDFCMGMHMLNFHLDNDLRSFRIPGCAPFT